VRFAAVSVEEYTSALAEQGVPPDVASLITYLFTEVLDGRNAKLADGVQRALGREPRDFRDYAAHRRDRRLGRLTGAGTMTGILYAATLASGTPRPPGRGGPAVVALAVE
jgi:hypothetical protein